MKKVKNILLLLTAIFTLGCSQTIVFEDIQTPTPTPTPKPEPEPDDKQLTSAPYAVGDYYYDGTKEGVVFDVWDNGNSGKIVSMMKSTGTLQWSSDETEQKRLIGADSETDGTANMAVVKAISGWESKYPAFKWCADLGDEWYLPSEKELVTISKNQDKIDSNLTDKLSNLYWSSTEGDYQYSDGRFCAWGVRMSDGFASIGSKYYYSYVRAVATFGEVPKPEPEPEIDFSTATDLSAAGTANCYLVKAAGTYKFKVVKGNSTQSVGAASSADVLWESFGTSTTPNEGDLIASATYKDGYVYFATPNTFKSGNASIAVRDSSGTILWSWHIWLSKEGWKDDVYPNNAGTMMDRNLGATSATPGSVGSRGLLYQWGRKDPFLGSHVSTNTLAVSTGAWSSVTTQQTVDYVTANPMIFVCGYSEWCTGDGAEDSNYAKRWAESEKTMYDPCPVGYRVPDGGENGFWATALGTSDDTDIGTTWDSTNKGRHWTLADGTTAAWYPAVGFYSYGSGKLGGVGSYGSCWSASPDPSFSSRAYLLFFSDGNVFPAHSNNRSYGYSVRCVSTTATSEPTPGITSAPYAVGDYYNDGTKEGVVFEVWDNGNSGKIVSMTESTTVLQWSSDETEQKRLIGADSETDGAYNTAKVKAISGWETKYPAFKWCADLGDGWYMPAKEELLTIYNNKDKLNTNLTDMLSSHNHWSSTEYDFQYSTGEFCAWIVDMYNGDTYISNKSIINYVRAVATFGDAQQSDPTPEPTVPANNEIWYTSTDGKVVTPAETGYFNVSITSNTYSNGKGVITFSGPITTVGEDKGEEPFLNCANLKSVVLPNGLKTIGYGAFSLCSGLESVTIPETVTYIKSGAFYDCNKLTAIALPSGLLRIDDNAFASCDLLESVTIPDSVTLIGRGAFSGEKLRAFYGKYASSDNKLIVFDGTVICSALGGLTEYSIPNVVKIIDYCAFSGYKNIKKFTIPNSVVSIGDGSFSYCTSLQDITIPDSVTEIVGGSFFNCTSLTSAILSKNLTKIGDATFMNCSKLKNIYCSAVTPPQCGKDLFEGVTTDFRIYVPASSVSAYKSASGWSTYADAIVADPSTFTSAPYAVGDYYNDGTKEGVVFEVWDNGNSGKIVSMMQSTRTLQWSSDDTEQKRLIGADSETDGAANMTVVKAISGWESKYPAFKWCADLGDDWYLPAKEELLTISNNKDKLNTNLTDMLSSNHYWSSTEYDDQDSNGYFCAWHVYMDNSLANCPYKSYYYYVRAVATFGNVPKPEPEPDLDYSTSTDLSAEGTANCYLVKAAGKYKFKAVKGNSAQSVDTASSADVLWESFGTSITPNVGDLIASATYKDGYVYFATPDTFKNGNASIAVRDSNAKILWSWHIWLSKEGWKDDVYPNNAGTMMDRNLGATSATPGDVGAFGLLYQWGRKDPFMGSCAISGTTLAASTGSWDTVSGGKTIDWAEENPTAYITGSEWCTGDGAEDSNYTKRWAESEKTMYDPCPVGYRVPDGGDTGFWATALGTSEATTVGTKWDSINYGRQWTLADEMSSAWYPAVGSRSYDSGSLNNVGEIGCCWSASSPFNAVNAYRLYFSGGVVYPSFYKFNRSHGYSVRCVRE